MSSDVRQVDLESAIKPQPRRLTRGQYGWRLLSLLTAILGLVFAIRNVIPTPEQKALLAADRALAAAAEGDDDAAFLAFWTKDALIVNPAELLPLSAREYLAVRHARPGFSLHLKPERAMIHYDSRMTVGGCTLTTR